MLKRILASSFLLWLLLEVNLTVETKKRKYLKQKAGERHSIFDKLSA